MILEGRYIKSEWRIYNILMSRVSRKWGDLVRVRLRRIRRRRWLGLLMWKRFLGPWYRRVSSLIQSHWYLNLHRCCLLLPSMMAARSNRLEQLGKVAWSERQVTDRPGFVTEEAWRRVNSAEEESNDNGIRKSLSTVHCHVLLLWVGRFEKILKEAEPRCRRT